MFQEISRQSHELQVGAATEPPVGGASALSSNRLLQALPLDARCRLIGKMKRVSLKKRQVIQDRNLPLTHAYFIEKGTASLVAKTGGRAMVEIRSLGPWDFVGIPLLLGTQRSPHRCIVQIPGEALQIAANNLADAMESILELRPLLLAYIHAALTHSSQLAVCGTCHSVEQRAARSLLLAADQIGSDGIAVTHEALGKALGVRRASVTNAMASLEQSGFVERKRGSIRIADREGLEHVCCDCYRAIRSAYDRVSFAAPAPSTEDLRRHTVPEASPPLIARRQRGDHHPSRLPEKVG